MYKLGFLSLLVYILMLIGVEKYRMVVMPFALLGLVMVYFKKRKFEVGSWKILISYLIILGAGYIFNLLSISGARGGEYFLILNTIFVFAFMFLNFIESEKELSTVINFFIGSGVLLAFVSIYQYISRYAESGWDIATISGYRTSGFENIFYTSVLLMVTGTVTVAKLYVEKLDWKNRKNIFQNYIYIFSAVIIFQGLLFTKTRASIYTFFGGSILILLSKIQLKKALLFLVALFAIYGANPSHVKSRAESIAINPNEEHPLRDNENLRRIMWTGAYHIWKDHPILGVGNDIEVVREKMADYSRSIEDENGYITYGIKGDFFRSKFTESHSTYFNFLMQNGMVILLYLIFFGGVLTYQFWINSVKIREFFLLKKIGAHKFSSAEYLGNENINIYESINIGAMVAIINLLVVGLAWDVWSWAFQVQEIFQLMVFFLMAVHVRLRVISSDLKEKKILEHEREKKLETKIRERQR